MDPLPPSSEVTVTRTDTGALAVGIIIEQRLGANPAQTQYRVVYKNSDKSHWYLAHEVEGVRPAHARASGEASKSRMDSSSSTNGFSAPSSAMQGVILDKASEEGEEDRDKPKEKIKRGPKPTTVKSSRPLDADYESLPVKLPLPPQLRKQLTDEHYTIHQSKELVPLPRTPCVNDILQNWVSETTTANSPEAMAVIDMLRLLFQDELGNHLLYRLERYQYAEFVSRNPNVSMDKVYGAEHLLRLFVILPWFLSNATLEETRIHSVKTVVANLLEYMRLNMSTFFVQEYEPASPAALQDAGFS